MSNLSIEEIENISFHKANLGGYKPEEVDMFIDEVQKTVTNLTAENSELMRKLGILAKKVEEYKLEEDSIRATLINAQKLASASVREAKHKAEVILKDAKVSAEKIVSKAKEDVLSQQNTVKYLQNEVVNFRTKLLDIYKDHLRLIDALPDQEDFKSENISKGLENEELEALKEEDSKDQVDAQESNESLDLPKHDHSATEEIEKITQEAKAISENMAEDQEDDLSEEEYATIKFDAIKFGENYDLSKDKQSK